MRLAAVEPDEITYVTATSACEKAYFNQNSYRT